MGVNTNVKSSPEDLEYHLPEINMKMNFSRKAVPSNLMNKKARVSKEQQQKQEPLVLLLKKQSLLQLSRNDQLTAPDLETIKHYEAVLGKRRTELNLAITDELIAKIATENTKNAYNSALTANQRLTYLAG